MTPERKKALARALHDNELLPIILDEIETAAINKCVGADPVDHETRAAMAAEVRAIRNFRRKLNAITGEANAGENRAPA